MHSPRRRALTETNDNRSHLPHDALRRDSPSTLGHQLADIETRPVCASWVGCVMMERCRPKFGFVPTHSHWLERTPTTRLLVQASSTMVPKQAPAPSQPGNAGPTGNKGQYLPSRMTRQSELTLTHCQRKEKLRPHTKLTGQRGVSSFLPSP